MAEIPNTGMSPVAETAFDPLDMNNYRVEKLRILEKPKNMRLCE